MMSPFEDVALPRSASRGRTYVYVLPCLGEDILKVGFSSAPLSRLRTLHPRYFEFFDIGRSFLIEVDYLRDARRIERAFINALVDHQAPSPLVIPRNAAGHSEWFRGAYSQVLPLGNAICANEALVMHRPLRAWLATHLRERLDLLYQWSSSVLAAIEFAQQNGAPQVASDFGKSLHNVLDCYVAIGIAVAEHVPEHVMAWYEIDRP